MIIKKAQIFSDILYIRSYHFFKKCASTLDDLETTIGRQNSAMTSGVRTAITSLMRRTAEIKVLHPFYIVYSSLVHWG